MKLVAVAVIAAGVLLGYLGVGGLLGYIVAGVAAIVWARVWVRSPHLWIDWFRETFSIRSKSAKTAIGRAERNRRQHGLASPGEIRQHGSANTVRKLAPQVRPSLDASTRRARRRIDPDQVGIELCRVGFRRVYASIEDVILAIGGPRTFKSGWLAQRITRFPGPMVTTSTRTDLYANTQAARRAVGPVQVLNAGGVADLDDDAVTFDVLIGCEDPDVASERATDMIPASTAADAEKWAEQARLAFSALLHAAALGGHTIDTVRTWVAAPRDNRPQILRILEEKSPSPSTIDDAAQFLDTNDRTQSSITTSITPAVKWLQSKTARRAAGLEDLWRPFNMDQLLESGGSLYVIGQVDDHVTPLMSALTGYVARNARRAARGGRLDPPLGLALDEAHQLKPPLPDWTSNMGGSGVTILVATQSRAQLIDTWGEAGAAVVLNNAGAVLLGGGTKDPADLRAWSDLAGERDERTSTRGRGGEVTSSQDRSVAVLPPAQLTNLPPKHVVVFRRGMPPALGRARMVWEAPWRERLPPWVAGVGSGSSPTPVARGGEVAK